MPCIPLTDKAGRRVGMICTAPERICLVRGIWMEYHPYSGPSFYPNKTTGPEIEDWWKNPRIEKAFSKWQKENPNA